MRFKQWVFLGLNMVSLIGMAFLTAQEEAMTIQSGEAEYNGKEISLIGHVVIQHEMGRISAHRLQIIPSTDKNKKGKFSFLKMKEDVVLDAKDGSQLCCQEAEIDYANLKGLFLGNAEHPDVMYTNKNFGFVKSQQMQVELTRQFDPQRQVHKSSIQQIEANRQVRAYYHQEYNILADKALYEKQPTNPVREILFLYVESPNQFCQVTNQSGDQLFSSQITIDLTNRQMWLDHPRGLLHVKENDQIRPIQFSAENLVWNDADHHLILQKGIYLQQDGIGEIRTNSEVNLYQRVIEGKKEVRSIISREETELKYQDEKSGTTHQIVCHGPLVIDHEHSQILFYSPVDEQNRVLVGKQVYFEDLAGEIYADFLVLSYAKNNHVLTPVKVVMQGNVQILNRYDGHLQESGSVLQYALADQVDYFPKEKEMILFGQNQRRVLLFDKVNNLQMSAPSLKIRRDEQSQKGSIQGIGDVRFTFIEHELDQIKQRFHLDEQSH